MPVMQPLLLSRGRRRRRRRRRREGPRLYFHLWQAPVQVPSPCPASQPGQAACWPWRYGPTSMWPNPVQPPKYPVHPQSAGEDCQQCPGLGKWLRMKIRMLPPCHTVGGREDAHSPRVKVVRLESWEEYSV